MTDRKELLLDVTRLIWRRWVGRLPTGIDRVCLAYLEHYGADAQAVIQWRSFRRILPEKASQRLFELLLSPPPNARRQLAVQLATVGMRPQRQLRGRGRLYLNVGHTALQEKTYVAWTRTVDVRPVYMIHDLIPITHPEYCRAGEAERHTVRVRNILATGVGIIGNSEATLDSLKNFAREVATPPPKMLAAPLGTGMKGRDCVAEPPVGRAKFVILGTIEARKNHLMLLQIWARLVRTYGVKAPRLLIIGQRGWECEQVFDLLDRSDLLRAAVTEIGSCSDLELNQHLRHARALLFPSMAEGYGLPLIEALSAGTPVIASDLPVFHEIGQEVPDFIDPLDGPKWHDAILDYMRANSPSRAAQMQRMEHYRPPSWGDHFARVDAWLGTL